MTTDVLLRLAEMQLHFTDVARIPGAPFERFYIDSIYTPPRLTAAKNDSLEVSALLDPGTRAVLVGGPGAGKTTLLRFLTRRGAQMALTHPGSAVPIFLTAAQLAPADGTASLIRGIIADCPPLGSIANPESAFAEWLERGALTLYVDGLDELPNPKQREDLTVALNNLARHFPNASIIAASRPAGLGLAFDHFMYLHLEPFDATQIRGLVAQLFSGEPERAADFFRLIASDSALYELSSNPLLLTLLRGVYEIRGTVPTNRARLYSDFTDYLLSTWDTLRGVRRESHVSIESKTLLLERIAAYLLEHGKDALDLDEIHNLIPYVLPNAASHRLVEEVVQEIATAGLLLEVGPQRFRFPHRTFVEYFTARSAVDDPGMLLRLIPARELHEVIVLACGLMLDVGPIIEAAIDKREILLAAKCISHGRTSNHRLADYVASSLAGEVGEPFMRHLATFMSAHPERRPAADEHAELLHLLERAGGRHLTAAHKGTAFEDFAASLFGKFFKVIYRNLNSESGEIDLVIEMTKADPFWADFGGEALIECKNWQTDTPLKDVGAFANKAAATRGIKLAFIVSFTGFTDASLRMLRNQVSDPTRPLIIPITGSDIRTMLIRRDSFEDFFKEAIRHMKHLRSY